MSISNPQPAQPPRYAMHIAWSEKDQAYLVTLPEWMPRLLNDIAVTHGATYEEAARNGQEALELLIEDAQASGQPLPEPQTIEYTDDGPEVASA
jgi:antitoxin HicB